MNFLGVYVPLSSSVNVNEHWTVHTDTVVHESHPHMRESIETLYRNVVVRVRHLSEWTRTRDSARKSVNGTLSCNKRTKTEDIDRTWKVIFFGVFMLSGSQMAMLFWYLMNERDVRFICIQFTQHTRCTVFGCMSVESHATVHRRCHT